MTAESPTLHRDQSKGYVAKMSGKPLENFRLMPGQSAFIRILSDKYTGLFTHYHHKRSVYCPGAQCTCPLGKVDRTWKGYCAVEVGKAGSPIWMPYCLEITESLELDFRHVFARGQVWEIFRTAKIDGKQPAYQGRLHDTLPAAKLRQPFNIMPVIMALYHRQDIDLAYASPIPDRVFVELSEDEAPKVFSTPEQAEKKRLDEMERQRQHELQTFYGKNKKAPSGDKNPNP